MVPERDSDLTPVQPAKRMAVVRGLRPRLWAKWVLAARAPADRPGSGSERDAAAGAEPGEPPLTYDDHAHLHGGPGSGPSLGLED